MQIGGLNAKRGITTVKNLFSYFCYASRSIQIGELQAKRDITAEGQKCARSQAKPEFKPDSKRDI